MTRIQFRILNSIGGLCAALILANLAMATSNGTLNQSVATTQGQFTQAQRIQNTTQSLVQRVAQAGQNEPVLRELLVRHNFTVDLNSGSPPKATP